MLKWLHRDAKESPGLTEIRTRFLQMIEDGRHIYDAAANSLLGGTDPEVIRADLFKTDKRINLTEQRIRREIVVHGTVHGAASFPALLIMMSLVKDAERIGDYAKNLFDLAAQRPDLGSEEERAQLIVMKDQISRLLARTHGLFENQDATSANDFLRENDALQDHCDDEVDRVLAAEGRNLAGMVLTLRFFKRITSHAGNIVTSIVMPLDKLDYFPGKPHSEQ